MDLSVFEGDGIDQVNKGISLLTQQLCNDDEEAEDQKRNLKGESREILISFYCTVELH